MKALTVIQPWALLIAKGVKNIENRSWKTKHRGRVFIHAGASNKNEKIPLDNVLTFDQWEAIQDLDTELYLVNGIWRKSAIIGEVDIVDCVINHDSVWAEKSNYVRSHVGVISKPPVYNWVLENAVMYNEPILGVKGKLSFWEFNR